MTFWEIAFVAYSCVGDFGFLGFKARPIPAEVRPIAAVVRIGGAPPICSIVPSVERLPSKAAAIRRVQELGPGASPRLRWCERLRCFDRPIEWKPGLVFDGKPYQ